MKRVFGEGRYANVTATLALVVALGGTSYAAVAIPRNSVGSAQIKNNGVAGPDIRPNAVTSAKVKNGSLLSTDFKSGQLPAGPSGATGATGATGPAGAPGATNVVMRSASALDSVARVQCQPGERAVGGGGFAGGLTTLRASFPIDAAGDTKAGNTPTGWQVTASDVGTTTVTVVCAR